MSKELATTGGSNLRTALTPQTFDQLLRFADTVGRTQFVPQAYRGKPEEIVAAVTYGADLGLTPMQSLQTIAVVNGKPTIYGDGLLAVCQSHPSWGGKKEWLEGTGDAMVAHCVVSRRGEPDAHATFSVTDAKKAQLWDKAGPWKQYSARMLAMRARGFALRDQFADALRGIITVEEASDYPPGPTHARDVTPRSVAAPLVDPAESVEVTDQHGQVEWLDPLAVPAWAEARAQESSDDELLELLALNEHAAVRDAVEAEAAKRAVLAYGDKPPVANPDEARRLYTVAKRALKAGDREAAVRARIEAAPHLDDESTAAFDALLDEKREAA